MSTPPTGFQGSQDDWDKLSQEQQAAKYEQLLNMTPVVNGPATAPAVFADPNWAQTRANLQSFKSGLATEQLGRQVGQLQPQLMTRAQRTLAQNPYDAGMADQSRAAQLALMQQMEAARVGPSLAAMQGRGAMGQSTQQALAAGAMGQGRGAMLGSGQAAAGLASDVARARMIEDLKARAGIGSAASQLRGQDISSAIQQLRAGQQSQALSDEMARFYGSQGASLEDLQRNAQLEQFKLNQRLRVENEKARDKAALDTANFWASIFGSMLK